MRFGFQLQYQPHTCSILPTLAARNFEVIEVINGKTERMTGQMRKGITIGFLFWYIQIFEV